MIAAALLLALAGDAGLAAPGDVAAPPRGAHRTSSGVAMVVLRRGQGPDRPRDNDCVRLHFSAWKRDGTFLSSSRQRQEPENQCLVRAFPGVAEALKQMVVGEERRIWVPAALTFTGDDDDHPPAVDATFDVELIAIQHAPPAPRFLKAPPPAARKTPSGLAIQVLKRGSGSVHPGDSGQVKLDVSGWTSDGRLIESTVMGGQPAVFPMAGVIAGWREALLTMVAGDSVRLWIPRDLAYGARPRRGQPRGELVYEVTLLEVQ